MESNVMSTRAVFDPRFLAFYQSFHEKFTPWQQQIKANRELRLHTIQKNKITIDYEFKGWPKEWENALPRRFQVPENFKIDLPNWCKDQRNQMTGPADDATLIIKMINSGAPGVMVDLEDSMANTWENLSQSYSNIHRLFKGDLSYEKDSSKIGIDHNSKSVIWVRPRGLHMAQILRFPTTLSTVKTSAALLDVCMTAYHFANNKLPIKQPLTFYIPKSEYAEEALWWAELFKEIAAYKQWPINFIKCMGLVESYTLAYQLDEYIYNLKDHIVGLNFGRWDYIASFIEMNMWDDSIIMPDRNTISHDTPFLQNVRKLLVNICHRRGILAIGGMTALFPNRKDAELNQKALTLLEIDKKNEAAMGMDGAWTGHPDQNSIAVSQFPEPNQIEFMHAVEQPKRRPKPLNVICTTCNGVGYIDPHLTGFKDEPCPTCKDQKPSASIEESLSNMDLRPPLENATITEEGTRQLIRASIRYRNGVLNGKGASLLDGYMEDLATDRICRAMITQRWRWFPNKYETAVISNLFDEELERLLQDGGEIGSSETLRKARILTQQYIFNGITSPN